MVFTLFRKLTQRNLSSSYLDNWPDNQYSNIPASVNIKLLGGTIDQHVSRLCRQASTQMNVLLRFKRLVDMPAKLSMFRTDI